MEAPTTPVATTPSTPLTEGSQQKADTLTQKVFLRWARAKRKPVGVESLIDLWPASSMAAFVEGALEQHVGAMSRDEKANARLLIKFLTSSGLNLRDETKSLLEASLSSTPTSIGSVELDFLWYLIQVSELRVRGVVVSSDDNRIAKDLQAKLQDHRVTCSRFKPQNVIGILVEVVKRLSDWEPQNANEDERKQVAMTILGMLVPVKILDPEDLANLSAMRPFLLLACYVLDPLSKKIRIEVTKSDQVAPGTPLLSRSPRHASSQTLSPATPTTPEPVASQGSPANVNPTLKRQLLEKQSELDNLKELHSKEMAKFAIERRKHADKIAEMERTRLASEDASRVAIDKEKRNVALAEEEQDRLLQLADDQRKRIATLEKRIHALETENEEVLKSFQNKVKHFEAEKRASVRMSSTENLLQDPAIVELRDKADNLSKQLVIAESEKRELKMQLDKLMEANAQAESRHDEAARQLALAEAQLQEELKLKVKLHEEQASLCASLQVASLSEVVDIVQSVRRELNDAQNVHEKLEASIKLKDDNIAALRASVDVSKSTLTERDREIDELKVKLGNLSAEMDTQRRELDLLTSQHDSQEKLKLHSQILSRARLDLEKRLEEERQRALAELENRQRLQESLRSIQDELKNVQDMFGQKMQQCADMERSINSLNAAVARSESEKNEVVVESQHQINQLKDQLEEQRHLIQQEAKEAAGKVQESLERANARVSQLENELSQTRADAQEESKRVEDSFSAKLAESKQRVMELEQELLSTKDKLEKDVQQKAKELQKQHEQEISAQKDAWQKAASDLKKVHEQALQDASKNAAAELAKIKKSLSEAERECRSLQSRLEELQKSADVSTRKMEEDIAVVQKKLKDANAQLSELSQEKLRAQKQLDDCSKSLQSALSYLEGRAVDLDTLCENFTDTVSSWKQEKPKPRPVMDSKDIASVVSEKVVPRTKNVASTLTSAVQEKQVQASTSRSGMRFIWWGLLFLCIVRSFITPLIEM